MCKRIFQYSFYAVVSIGIALKMEMGFAYLQNASWLFIVPLLREQEILRQKFLVLINQQEAIGEHG